MYAAIKSQEIRQPAGFQPPSSQMSSLAPNTPYNTLMRHRSQRGQDRMTMLKRGSIRGIQTLLGQQAGVSPYSSNSSIEGSRDPRDGRVSPSPSFATSIDVSAAAFRVLYRRFMVLRLRCARRVYLQRARSLLRRWGLRPTFRIRLYGRRRRTMCGVLLVMIRRTLA